VNGMEEKSPEISVVVPVYNVEAYVEKCLDSIFAQTYPNYEIIAIDDHSTDHSGRICDRCAVRDKRLKVVHFSSNRGPSAARNEGIHMAQGNYITFVDADDVIEPDFLEKLYRNLTANEADISICGTGRPGRGKSGPPVIWGRAEAVRCMSLRTPFDHEAWGKLYLTALVRQTCFHENVFYGEDLLFFYQTLKRARRVSYLPERLYHHVCREGNLTSSCVSERKCRSGLWVYRYICHDAAVSFPELLPNFQAIALNGIGGLAVLAVEKGTEDKGVFAYLKILKRDLRKHFHWRALARLPGKKAAGVLVLCVSNTAFYGAVIAYKGVKRWLKR